jgi:hypothetical protein
MQTEFPSSDHEPEPVLGPVAWNLSSTQGTVRLPSN